jgi:hypothetical protein
VPYYRLYFIDPRSGHIARFTEIHAPDDAAATELASEIEHRPLELWNGGRYVARIGPELPAAPQAEAAPAGPRRLF